MKGFPRVLARLKRRERILILLCFLMVLVVVAYEYALMPYVAYKDGIGQKLEAKLELLQRYERIASRKDKVFADAKSAQGQKRQLEAKFLKAETEALASAELQRRVKKVATDTGVVITRSSSGKGFSLEPGGRLKLLAVRFDIKARTMRAIRDFLYQIEYGDDSYLFIDRLMLTKMQRGEGIRGTANVNAVVLLKGIGKAKKG